VPNSVTYLDWTLIFELFVVARRISLWIPQRHVFHIDWIVCSKCGNHSRLNNQHNLEGWGIHDHLLSM